MTLDRQGILTTCTACGTTNRLKYAALERPTRCGKCHADLAFPAAPIEVPGTAEFDAAIASASIPILVDFWAAWCGPCRMVAPEVNKVAERLAGKALVLKVDTDANAELSQRYQIRSIPTLAVFEGGREARRTAGVQRAEALEQLLAGAHA
jgi:thioredoxin 2